MRRASFIAALVLSLACWPAWAQHGGGHGGGGGGHAGGGFSGGGHAFSGGGGFSGGHSGFSGGAHSFSGAHSYNGTRSYSGVRPGYGYAGRPYNRSYNRGSVLAGGAYGRGSNRSGVGVRIRSYPYGYGYGYGYGRGYGYCGWGCWGYGSPYLWGGIDPYWWWDNGSDSDSGYDAGYGYNPGYSYDADYGDDPVYSYNPGNGDPGQRYDTGLANQMRQQGVVPWRPPDSGNQNYSRSTASQDPSGELASNTVLVFRDQHKQEVQNYAIIGQTLWTFAPQHSQKIPLSALDIPATEKANDERGVTFRIPGVGEGQ
jgi:hypothetical protein